MRSANVLSLSRMKRGELFDYLTEKVTLSEKETRSGPFNSLSGKVPKGKEIVFELLSMLCVLVSGRLCALWWRWCSSSTARVLSIGTWSQRTSSWTTRWTSNWPTLASLCRSTQARRWKVCERSTSQNNIRGLWVTAMSPVLWIKHKQVMWSCGDTRWHPTEAYV